MRKLFLCILVIVCNTLITKAQTFERLIEFPDTLAFAHQIMSSQDNHILILSTAYHYVEEPGFPINGYGPHGTVISTLNKQGETLWQSVYPTHVGSASSLPFGNIPTEHFVELYTGEIFLPYSLDVGALVCEENSTTSNVSRKLNGLWVSAESSEIEDTRYFTHEYCANEVILGVFQSVDNTINIVFSDFQNNSHSLIKLRETDETVIRYDYDSLLLDIAIIPIDNELTLCGTKAGKVTFTHIDEEGSISWKQLYADTIFLDPINTFYQTDIGYTSFVGYRNTASSPFPENAKILYFDVTGNFIEGYEIPSLNIQAVIQLADGSYLVAFIPHNRVEVSSSFGIALINQQGEIIRKKYYGGIHDTPVDIDLISEGEFMVVGNHSIPRTGGGLDSAAIFIVKDQIENLATSIKTVPPNPMFSVFPNPTSDVITLSYDFSSFKAPLKYKIFDSKGRLIQSNTVSSIFNPEIDVDYLTTGLYFLTVSNNEYQVSTKFLKQ